MLLLVTASSIAALAPPAAAAAANAWGAPASLESEPANASQVRTAVSADGTAVAVWVQATATAPYIAASAYAAGGSWGATSNVSWGATVSLARVAAVGSDRFLAAWVGANNVSVNWYAEGVGWSGPSLVYDAGAAVQSLALAGDGAGRAALAWTVSTGFATRMQVSLYAAGLGWSAPTQLSSLASVNAAAVALGGQGGAVAAWRESNGGDGTNSRIAAAVYSPGWGWSASSPLTSNYPNANFTDLWPSVAMAPNGSAVVLARVQLGTPYAASRFDPGVGWHGPTLLAPVFGGIAATQPTISMDGAGNAIVPLTEFLMNGSFAAELMLYDGAADSWTARWVPGSGSPSGGAAAAYDLGGRALVAWAEDQGSGFVARAVRFLPGAGWGAPVDFSLANGSLVAQGRMAVSLGAEGEGAIAWIDNTSNVNDVYGAAFARDTVAPMLSLTSPTAGATNTTAFTVSGTTDTDAALTVDGSPVSVDGGTGAFTTALTLLEGGHTFVVVATDAEGNAAEARVTVVVDLTAPLLVVSSPTDGAALTVPLALVSGRAEAGAVVKVNGAVVPAFPDGSFTTAVPLTEGSNMITVTATDAAGNRATAAVAVGYTAPAPAGLAEALAQLAAANASLAAAKASLASADTAMAMANANVSAALAAAAAANAALASALADANASEAARADAQAAYERAQANLTDAQGQTASSASQLSAAQAAYTAASAEAVRLSDELNTTRADLGGASASANGARADAATAQSQAANAGTLASGALLAALVGIAVALAALRRGRGRPAGDEFDSPRKPAKDDVPAPNAGPAKKTK